MIARYATSAATIDRPTLRERAYGGLRQIPNILVFIAIAIGGGLGASWFMVERGSPLTTKRYGPWSIWIGAGRPDTDPYTRAHYLRRGMLAEPGGLVETYFARTDNSGQGLRAYCDYRVSGNDPAALSWSIAAFTSNGGLIQNRAGRYAYNSSTVMRSSGGRFQITLSRDAQPGNWLPVGGAGSFTLVFTIHEPTQRVSEDGGVTNNLPVIEQVQCR
jgi:hypothetical protein